MYINVEITTNQLEHRLLPSSIPTSIPATHNCCVPANNFFAQFSMHYFIFDYTFQIRYEPISIVLIRQQFHKHIRFCIYNVGICVPYKYFIFHDLFKMRHL